MQQQSHYEILEIPSDADAREIKRAYHRLARDLHPDKATSEAQALQFEQRFALVSAAYNALKEGSRQAESGGATATQAPAPARPNPTAAVLAAGRGTPAAAQPPPRPAPAAAAPQAARQTLGLTPEKAAIAQKAFARGMQYFKESNFAKAIDFFEAAIQNNDTEPAYHARLALSLIQARRSANRAIEAAQRAIELDPYNLEHKFILASIFATIGSKSNAQRVYEEILRWDADNLRAQQALKELTRKQTIFNTPLSGGGNGSAKAAGAKPGLLDGLLSRFRR